ncbi:hypothetical protein ACFLWN_04990, partial [Chloroflexota bacterium]
AEQLLTSPNKAAAEGVAQAKVESGEQQGKALDDLLKKANEDEAEVAPGGVEAPESDDFFGSEEAEENRLAGLIAALPDVSIDDMLREAEEIKALVKEWVPEEKE